MLGSPDLGCASAEVVIPRAGLGQTVPFELVHALPEQVMLRFGVEQPSIERSSDGGASWQLVSSYEWWENYFFIDRDVEEGATYHYRIKRLTDPVYLGQTMRSPGLPVTIPVWAAPRVVPELLDVEWHCPVGSALPFCNGTLNLHLAPEPGETLSGATIRVFLNEATHQLQDGVGEDLRIDWEEGLNEFRGRDVPGCVIRKAIPDLEILVPVEENLDRDFSRRHRFRSERAALRGRGPGGGFSERAILVALHEDPIYDTYSHVYSPFQPVLFGNVSASTTLDIWGVGPASRYSPDCVDGDLTYEFSRPEFDNDALYLNHLELEGQDQVLVGTDGTGLWSHSWSLADGTYDFAALPGRADFYGNGFVGRVLLDEAGDEITDALATYVRSNLMSATREIVVDSTVSDLGPNLDRVVGSLLLDDSEVEAPGIVRFRVTDADHDLPLDGITVSNLSTAAPSPVVAFYARNQYDDVGNWGWFVVELPLIAGENILEFCAEDAAGNVLGTIEEPCVPRGSSASRRWPSQSSPSP